MNNTKKFLGLLLTFTAQSGWADHHCGELRILHEPATKTAVAVYGKGEAAKFLIGTYVETGSSGWPHKPTQVSGYKLEDSSKNKAEITVSASYNCNRATCDAEHSYAKTAKLTYQGVSHEYTCETFPY